MPDKHDADKLLLNLRIVWQVLLQLLIMIRGGSNSCFGGRFM